MKEGDYYRDVARTELFSRPLLADIPDPLRHHLRHHLR